MHDQDDKVDEAAWWENPYGLRYHHPPDKQGRHQDGLGYILIPHVVVRLLWVEVRRAGAIRKDNACNCSPRK